MVTTSCLPSSRTSIAVVEFSKTTAVPIPRWGRCLGRRTFVRHNAVLEEGGTGELLASGALLWQFASCFQVVGIAYVSICGCSRSPRTARPRAVSVGGHACYTGWTGIQRHCAWQTAWRRGIQVSASSSSSAMQVLAPTLLPALCKFKCRKVYV